MIDSDGDIPTRFENIILGILQKKVVTIYHV